MKKESKPILIKYSLTLYLFISALVLPESANAQWSRLSRWAPTLVTRCQAESSDTNYSQTYIKTFSEQFEATYSNVLETYDAQIQALENSTGKDIKGAIKRDIINSDFGNRLPKISQLRAEGLISAEWDNVSDLGLSAVREYTMSSMWFNAMIRSGFVGESNSASYYRAMKYLMDDAMKRAVLWNAEGAAVFRGVGGKEADMILNVSKGDILMFDEYKSTSKLESVAEKFAEYNGDPSSTIVLEISEVKGYDIQAISFSPDQKEVLIPGPSQFEIIAHEDILSDEGYKLGTKVYLRQLEVMEPILPFQAEYDTSGSLESLSEYETQDMSPMGTSVSPESLLNIVNR